MIKVIEQYLCSKTGDDSKNEDLIFVSDDFCVLLDGTTSKTKALFHGKTAGQLTIKIIEELFRSRRITPETDPQEAVELIQKELKDFSRANDLESKEICLCASGLIYHAAKRRIWSVGDCQFLVNGVLYSKPKRIDALLGEIRSVMIRCLLHSGYSEADLLHEDRARGMIIDLLKKQRFLENTDDPYGYAVFSCRGGVPEVSITDVSCGDEIVFASDGYPELCRSLAESEAKLKELTEKDPLMYRYTHMTKGVTDGNVSYDDRSYIRFIAG